MVNNFFKSTNQSTQIITADILPDEILKEAFVMWDEAKGPQYLPTKNALTTEKLRNIIGYCSFIEVEALTGRFKYVFVGSHHIELLGKELCGNYIDEIYEGDIKADALDAYRKVLRTRAPLYTLKVWNTIIRKIGYQRLLLPFENADGTINFIIACITPTDKKIKSLKDWQEASDIQSIREFLELADS